MFGCVKTLLLFYQTNFRVNVNAEFLADRSPHGIRKSDNIRSRGTTRVHQYQRLQAMHSGVAFAKAFPPCPLDQPAGGQLDQPLARRITDQVGMLCADALGQRHRHQRIFEETPGIAQLGRIRQLLAARGAARR